MSTPATNRIASTFSSPALSPEQRSAFAQDGFLILRGVMPQPAIDGLLATFGAESARLIALLKAEGALNDLCTEVPVTQRLAVATAGCREQLARFGRGWRRSVACGAIHDLAHAPGLVAALAGLLDGPVYGHPIYNARPKLPQQALTVVPRMRQAAIAAAVARAGLCLRANFWKRYIVVGGQARTGSSER